MRFKVWIVCSAILLVFLAGCDTSSPPNTDPLPVDPNLNYKFTQGSIPLEVWVRLSKRELDLTDYLIVTIETRAAEAVRVIPPYLSEEVYSPLLLIEQPKQETTWSQADGILINRWIYTFEPLESGEHTLKPFSIYFRLEKEKTERIEQWPDYELQTTLIPYTVIPFEVGQQEDIRDMIGLIVPPYNFIPPVVVILVLGGILTGYLIWLRRRTIRHQGNLPFAPAIDYYQHSLERLQSLERKNLIAGGKFDAFFTELSIILRDYLDHKFGLRAKEQTTQEVIAELMATRQFTDEQRQDLDRYLQLADLVKFATFQPGHQISEAALNGVRTFIYSTGKPHEI